MLNSERRSRALTALVEASLATLGEVGYTRLRTADVAKRSGMSEGALFRYFPTKYDLIRASLEMTLDRHVNRLVAAFVDLEAGQVDRRSLLEMLWELLSHHEMAWTFELFAASYTDRRLRETIAPALNRHSEQVDEASITVMEDIAGVPRDFARQAINLSTWAMQGLVLRDMGRGDSRSQGEVIELLLILAEAAYPQPPKPANSTSKVSKATASPAEASKSKPTKVGSAKVGSAKDVSAKVKPAAIKGKPAKK
jgi:AcrR family transcriptional regulator